MSNSQTSTVSSELFDEVLLCARYGDLTDLEEYFTALDPKAIDILLSKQDSHGNTPLHFCSANGHLDVVKLFISRSKGGIDLVNEGGNTALHWACLNGHLSTVKFLVHSGADVKLKNSGRRMPIDEAESQGKESIVLWLLALDIKREKEAGLLDPETDDVAEGEVNVNMSAGVAGAGANDSNDESAGNIYTQVSTKTETDKEEIVEKVDKMNMLD